ncbi:MAG: type VII secretion protein EssC, partial [Anaerolineae bacterium]
SPRTFPSLPTGEVEIQAPPQAPARPTSSLVAVLLPFSFTILALGVSVAFVATNPTYLLISVPMMLGSGLVGLFNYSGERSKYQRTVEERQRMYTAYLQQRHQELTALADRQRQAALSLHPDPRTCLAIARRDPDAAPRLWERSSGLERPRDPDFLHLRLGTGRLAAAFKVKPPPAPAQVGEADELLQQAMQLAASFQTVDGVPIALPLADVGAAGLAGPRPAVLDSARALLVQMAALHAPHEVKLVAFLPDHELDQWEWIRWLPHIWDEERKRRFIAVTPDQAQALAADFFPLLQRRALKGGGEDTKVLFSQTYLFLFADPALYGPAADTAGIGPLLRLILTQGAAIGAYGLFLGDRPEALPGACGAVVDLAAGRLRLMGPPTQEIPFSPDQVNAAWADTFARTLAPIRLRPLAATVGLPSTVSLLALLKAPAPQDIPISSLWGARDTHQSLEAPVGLGPGGGPLLVNFQDTARGGDGSHAMVGGTTGTGKTRFLQTLVTLLAVHHHPHDVNFILIDYKGGDLLRGLEDLPHVVGTLANLEKQDAQAVLVERLFVCLEAELRRRRNLLGGADINTYQRDFLQGKRTEAVPHLFVIIDEFAEMIRNSPDRAAMTKRLLSIGATGRSLGVHLVLATQDPSGVVNDELRNNINTRLCLRMGSREASQAILRRPDAYEHITSAQVGRAILQVGNNDRFEMFQVAWGGDPYRPGRSDVVSAALYEVKLNGERVPLRAYRPLAPAGQTQLDALISQIVAVAQAEGIGRLGSPLLPPLREQVFLSELRAGEPGWNGAGWDARPGAEWPAPIIGQLDDLENQVQPLLRLPLSREGHLVLFGEPGSGKTTFVQTLVTSLALDHSPSDVHLYLLDFSGQRLLFLRGFPHVGDVFLADDVDRLKRFFRFLTRELETRKGKFARLGAANLKEYRALGGDPLPAIVTILEDYDAFNRMCQDRNLDLSDTLAQLVREGGAYGLHFVLTMVGPNTFPTRLATSISLAASFHLATRDYAMAVGPTGGMEPAPLPGRGLLKGPPLLEFQTALPADGATDAERTRALQALMEQMERAWGQRPRPALFPPIPAVVGLSHLVTPAPTWPDTPPEGYTAAFALDVDDPDRPFEVPLADGPYFLIAGTPRCGKTSLLLAWALALAERYPPSALTGYAVDFRGGGLDVLRDLPHFSALQTSKGRKGAPRYITAEDHLAAALAEIEALMQKRQDDLAKARQKAGFNLRAWVRSLPALWMLIDDYDAFKAEADAAHQDLLNLNLKRWRDLGFYLAVAGPIGEMETDWGWIKLLRDNPVGFQMGTAQLNQIFKINLPSDHPAKLLAPGEAFYVHRGLFRHLKMADPHVGPLSPHQWVEQIRKRE